jgi:FkbM family methyltransferase
LDIGANYGYYSLLLSDLVGPDGFCLAAEPNPFAVRKLTKNLAINGFASRSKVLPAALGRSASGQVSLFVPMDEPKNACIVASGTAVPPGFNGIIEQVEMTSVDAICAGQSKIDFVKIDAEGSEFDIILGMLETLNRFRPRLLLEFNANRDYDADLLLTKLSEIYGEPKYLDYDAELKEAAKSQLLARDRRDDWMLYYE